MIAEVRLTDYIYRMRRFLLVGGMLGILFAYSVEAQRVPVLNQIDLPHNYYYHELYLPQLTSGPSSVSWIPDGKALIYSMAGSLWMQSIGSDVAQQLTDDTGYDYQPDVSPDGKHVLFVRYTGTAVDLMMLNLAERKSYRLTDGKSVNLEPRWSPDGSTIAFVSTINTGHFLLHKATVRENQLINVMALIPDRKSDVIRYYYSPFDHSINPTWSKDGKVIYFISNREVAHGTGNLSSIDIASGEIKTIREEETNWRTRPDVSPDGTRIVYSSYLGQNWHQLWILPVNGGYPVPITYGDHDKNAPRWSPDGKSIAFISNKDGNASLWTLDTFSGKQSHIVATRKNYLSPHVPLTLTIQDNKGNPIAARVSITDRQGKFYSPDNLWVHADDSRYPATQTMESHYVHTSTPLVVQVPKDSIFITASHGPVHGITRVKVLAKQVDAVTLSVKISPLSMPSDHGSWRSGDVHVHMNYGGNYRNTPEHLAQQAAAEDLNFVYNLIVNKEQRIPDINYFAPAADKASTADVTILHGQEFHTSYWGHLGLLNLKDHLIMPDYSGYPETAVSSLFPHNSFVADRAHEQKGLVGYVHPFEQSEVLPDQAATLHNALPVDAALGKVDYYELIGFSDHRASESVWYQLLNAGLRIPAAAGTDAMANYASLRGPVGLNRVFVRGDNTMTSETFLTELRRGRSFVTNGPLVGISLEGKVPGDSVDIGQHKKTLNYKGFLRSNTPVERVEVVYNGDVIATHTSGQPVTTLDIIGKISVKESGWLLLRAWSSGAHPDVFDLYPYASTNPIYLVGGTPSLKRNAASAYFVKWTQRLEKLVGESTSFRTDQEKASVLDDLIKAKVYYQSLAAPGKH